jgi:hypothetical protein
MTNGRMLQLAIVLAAGQHGLRETGAGAGLQP